MASLFQGFVCSFGLVAFSAATAAQAVQPIASLNPGKSLYAEESATISLASVPETPRFDEVTHFEATIASEFPLNPFSVELFYREGMTGSFTALPMVLESGTSNQGIWKTTLPIPALPGNREIQYHLEARNLLPKSLRYPASGELSFVIFEPEAPQIAAHAIPAAPMPGEALTLGATITSERGMNPFSVTAKYSTSHGRSGEIALALVSGTMNKGRWETALAIDDISTTETIFFDVTGSDLDGRTARTPEAGAWSVNITEPTPEMPTPIIPRFLASKTEGTVPFNVTFTDATTGAEPTDYEWDFNGDGETDSTERNPAFTFTTPGVYSVTMKHSAGTKTRKQYINANESGAIEFIVLN